MARPDPVLLRRAAATLAIALTFSPLAPAGAGADHRAAEVPIRRAEDGTVRRADPAASAATGLPRTLGRARRNQAGEIVATGEPGDPDAPAAGPNPRPFGQSGVAAMVSLRAALARYRSRQAARARQIQAEVSRVTTAEHARKLLGRVVDQHGLTLTEQVLVQRLALRDRAVRAHEQAHYSAARPYARPPRFYYVRGPDLKRYAVSGYVPIDTSLVVGNRAATRAKLVQLRRAALAPGDVSAADRAVAQTLARALQALD